MDSFLKLMSTLSREPARYVLIGVAGVNYYAMSGATLFTTKDRDLFLPPDPENLLTVWRTMEAQGLQLWAGAEPLGKPLDRLLADRVVERKALTMATDNEGLEVDLTFVMAGFEFDQVWDVFRVKDVEIPVARLTHIVTSKAKANRPKDRLFLETHAEALKDLMDD